MHPLAGAFSFPGNVRLHKDAACSQGLSSTPENVICLAAALAQAGG